MRDNWAANCFQDPNFDPALGITTRSSGPGGTALYKRIGRVCDREQFRGGIAANGQYFSVDRQLHAYVFETHLKFGVDVRRQRFDQFLFFDVSGEYIITSNATRIRSHRIQTSASYPNYFLGAPDNYTQGAAQREDLRNTSLYLFAQDSFKIKPNLTLNYGLRWELNTPYYDTGNRLQTFRPGQVTTQYPCWLSRGERREFRPYVQVTAGREAGLTMLYFL